MDPCFVCFVHVRTRVMVSHYSTDQLVAVTHTHRIAANKDGEEEDCKLINMDGNKKIFLGT